MELKNINTYSKINLNAYRRKFGVSTRKLAITILESQNHEPRILNLQYLDYFDSNVPIWGRMVWLDHAAVG